MSSRKFHIDSTLFVELSKAGNRRQFDSKPLSNSSNVLVIDLMLQIRTDIGNEYSSSNEYML